MLITTQGFLATESDVNLQGFGVGISPGAPNPTIVNQGIGSNSALCVEGFLQGIPPPPPPPPPPGTNYDPLTAFYQWIINA